MPRVAVVIVAAALACNEAQSSPIESCAGEPAFCENSNTLRICEGDVWVPRACEDECAAVDESYPFGCLLVPNGDDRCNCEVDTEPDPCAAGVEESAMCSFDAGRLLSACVDGEHLSIACAEICRDAHDVGCFYDPALDQDTCLCARPGDPCDVLGYPTCVGDDLLRCDEQTWELIECPACDDRPACITDVLGVGACGCG